MLKTSVSAALPLVSILLPITVYTAIWQRQDDTEFNTFWMFVWLYYDAVSAAGLHRWNKMIISNQKKKGMDIREIGSWQLPAFGTVVVFCCKV